jgi:hypothetical protein
VVEGIEDRVLRRMLGPKTEEVSGGWRMLHNEQPIICTHQI